VEVTGIDTFKISTKELATKVGMVFQDPENQLVSADVEREIAFGLENLAFSKDVIAKRIEESLDTVGIAGLRRRSLHELSGGEKQKVAIASVLALHPSVLILDEPTSELDPKGAEDVLNVISRLNDELGITVVIVEHRLDRVIHYADRLMVIDGGRIVADGQVRQILKDNYTQLTDAGIGIPPVIRLVQEIRNRGMAVEQLPLTVKEGRTILKEIFSGAPTKTSQSKLNHYGRPLIDTKKLYYSYANGVAAIKNINLTINEGEFIAIMGRNASGKTTLVKHFNGLLKPGRGTVRVDSIDTRNSTIAELAGKAGYVFQNPNDHLSADTVADEIACTMRNLGFNNVEVKQRTEEVLLQFNLTSYRNRYPRYLSGGEKQRVALASVVAARPRILILDEPTRGMEYRLKSELMRFLDGYRRQGNAVILVSHDVEVVAEYVDRVVLMSEGGIVVDGNKHDVLSNALLFSPQINRLVQAFEEYGVPSNILTVQEALDILL
jgi:energy-coupling factor transport system ATP-binding protein